MDSPTPQPPSLQPYGQNRALNLAGPDPRGDPTQAQQQAEEAAEQRRKKMLRTLLIVGFSCGAFGVLLFASGFVLHSGWGPFFSLGFFCLAAAAFSWHWAEANRSLLSSPSARLRALTLGIGGLVIILAPVWGLITGHG